MRAADADAEPEHEDCRQQANAASTTSAERQRMREIQVPRLAVAREKKIRFMRVAAASDARPRQCPCRLHGYMSIGVHGRYGADCVR